MPHRLIIQTSPGSAQQASQIAAEDFLKFRRVDGALECERVGDSWADRNYYDPYGKLEVVLDSQVFVRVALRYDIRQHSRSGGVRDVVIQREGEGKVRLRVRFNVDILLGSTTDGIVVDRINEV